MAQSTTTHVGAAVGNLTKAKVAIITIVNTAAETTFTLVPATYGMGAFWAVIPVDEIAAAAVRVNPTRVGGVITSAALTFTAGDEITVLLIGD